MSAALMGPVAAPSVGRRDGGGEAAGRGKGKTFDVRGGSCRRRAPHWGQWSVAPVPDSRWRSSFSGATHPSATFRAMRRATSVASMDIVATTPRGGRVGGEPAVSVGVGKGEDVGPF